MQLATAGFIGQDEAAQVAGTEAAEQGVKSWPAKAAWLIARPSSERNPCRLRNVELAS
jgi:hypothetical protein